MGTGWQLRYVPPAAPGTPDTAGTVERMIADIFARIISEMSQWEAESDLSRFNRAPVGQWRALPPDILRVLRFGIQVAEASGGTFNPAMGVLSDLWGFGAAPRDRDALPDAYTLAQAAEDAAPGAIEIDTLLQRARRMRPAALDFAGIAKGYAVDCIADRLREAGLNDFLIEVGGELRGHGIRPDGQPWWVDVETLPDIPPLRVALHETAIATSGDTVRFREIDGQRYAHSIDPRTGWPIDSGVALATVLHPQCMAADAWATALTVAGPDAGMAMAAREGLAVRMLVREKDGGVRELVSPSLHAMLD